MIATCTPDGRLTIEGANETRIDAGESDWREPAEAALRSQGYEPVGAWAPDLDGNQVIQIELVSAPHLPPTQDQPDQTRR